MVPPRWMMPPTSRAPKRYKSPEIKPAYPCRTPKTSQPLASPVRTTARMAAFMPGASPPLVSTAILFMVSPSYPLAILGLQYEIGGEESRTSFRDNCRYDPSVCLGLLGGDKRTNRKDPQRIGNG